MNLLLQNKNECDYLAKHHTIDVPLTALKIYLSIYHLSHICFARMFD